MITDFETPNTSTDMYVTTETLITSTESASTDFVNDSTRARSTTTKFETPNASTEEIYVTYTHEYSLTETSITESTEMEDTEFSGTEALTTDTEHTVSAVSEPGDLFADGSRKNTDNGNTVNEDVAEEKDAESQYSDEIDLKENEVEEMETVSETKDRPTNKDGNTNIDTESEREKAEVESDTNDRKTQPKTKPKTQRDEGHSATKAPTASFLSVGTTSVARLSSWIFLLPLMLVMLATV